MPRVAKELSAVEVKRINAPGFHAVGGVPGLLLKVKPTGSRQWVLRAMVGAKRRDMGLGGFPAVTLAQARERAREYRELIFQGHDPVEQRRKRISALKAEQETRITVRQAWAAFWKDKSAGLAAATRRHWENSVERYALPAIGDMIVSEVELRHVEQVLRPIWESRTETASKLRGRLEAVFSWATVKGYREGDNPARWASGLKELLPPPSRVANSKHHRALDIDDAPAFIAELRNMGGMAARCLELVILAGVRSGEGRAARWEQFDLKAATWSIPAEQMKMSRDHVVPLPDASIHLLQSLEGDKREGLVFTNSQGRAFSDMALLAVLRRMKWADRTTVHGFRAVFKSWSVERTDAPDFVSEMALAHSVGDQIMKAYQRSDLLAKRRKLMREWSQFLGYEEKGGQVVQMEASA